MGHPTRVPLVFLGTCFHWAVTFNVNELPKRTTDCCIAEKRVARVAKFGFSPGQFRPVIFIREECNASYSDMRNGIGCALE